MQTMKDAMPAVIVLVAGILIGALMMNYTAWGMPRAAQQVAPASQQAMQPIRREMPRMWMPIAMQVVMPEAMDDSSAQPMAMPMMYMMTPMPESPMSATPMMMMPVVTWQMTGDSAREIPGRRAAAQSSSEATSIGLTTLEMTPFPHAAGEDRSR